MFRALMNKLWITGLICLLSTAPVWAASLSVQPGASTKPKATPKDPPKSQTLTPALPSTVTPKEEVQPRLTGIMIRECVADGTIFRGIGQNLEGIDYSCSTSCPGVKAYPKSGQGVVCKIKGNPKPDQSCNVEIFLKGKPQRQRRNVKTCAAVSSLQSNGNQSKVVPPPSSAKPNAADLSKSNTPSMGDSSPSAVGGATLDKAQGKMPAMQKPVSLEKVEPEKKGSVQPPQSSSPVLDSTGKNQMHQKSQPATPHIVPGDRSNTVSAIIKVVSPNGGESLTLGDTVQIKWNIIGPVSDSQYVKLFLYQGERLRGQVGPNYSAIPGEKHTVWQVGVYGLADLGSNYRIKAMILSKTSEPLYSDFSDAGFTIKAKVIDMTTLGVKPALMGTPGTLGVKPADTLGPLKMLPEPPAEITHGRCYHPGGDKECAPGDKFMIGGHHFGNVRGKVFASASGFTGDLELSVTDWDTNGDFHRVTGFIPPNIQGVKDQPMSVRIERSDDSRSNNLTLEFRATRVAKILKWPDQAISVSCSNQSGDCNVGYGEWTFLGFHATGDGYQGSDWYSINLMNGWIIVSGKYLEREFDYTEASLEGPIPAWEKGMTSWNPKFKWKNSVTYSYQVTIEGPKGVPYH